MFATTDQRHLRLEQISNLARDLPINVVYARCPRDLYNYVVMKQNPDSVVENRFVEDK